MTDRAVWMNDDMVRACAYLVGRCGACDFEIGYVHEDVPSAEAGWYAQAVFKGARVMVGDMPSPTLAALALSERMLRGATCRCRQPVTLSDSTPGCRWRLVGPRYEPGCDAAPMRVHGERGDYAAMQRALAAAPPANRAERRRSRGPT